MKIYLDIDIDAENTIIFFDEIQESEEIISCLKYFNESEEPYKIICAGSLLGVKLKRLKSAFPVGKVKMLNMYPMDSVLHEKALSLYRLYLCVGGMPESIKIEAIYKSIPLQLGNQSNKFQYGKISSNARKRDYEIALDWLTSSTMVHKCSLLNKPEIPPLAFIINDHFKLYLSDVGILLNLLKIKYNDIILDRLLQYKGIIAENYVATQLLISEYQQKILDLKIILSLFLFMQYF